MSDENAGRVSRAVRRRDVLAMAGGTLGTGLAGCVSAGDGTEESAPAGTASGSTETASATESSTDDPPATAAGEGGPPTDVGWELTFESTFSDGEWDGSTWALGAGYEYTCAAMECWEEDAVWVDENTERLVIETTDEPSGDAEYTSAAVATRDVFQQEFGYFEAKSRPPAQPGALPAFWAWWNADDWTYRREIDVYEIGGTAATTATHSVHMDCGPREQGAPPTVWRGGESTLETPADETFHVWGVEWTPESVAFYVDGEERVRVEDTVVAECFAGEPLWLLLSTHVNDGFGDPAEADYPYTHEFEWVRAWQHENWA